MSKARLIEIVRENLGYAQSGTMPQAADIGRVPVEHYFDPERWQRECDQIFKRMPLVLATTSELRQPGDYKALSVMDKPVLICRTADGKIKAFENSCAHRGSQVVATGRGNAKRFVCPYHAWVDKLLETKDDDLPGLFGQSSRQKRFGMS